MGATNLNKQLRMLASDGAAKALREQILSGNIPDGEIITQEWAAEQLQISRTPIREAFRQLEYEGILERKDNRHVQVRGISIANLYSRLRVLRALELDLLTVLNEKLSEYDDLERLFKKWNEAVTNNSISESLMEETRFHQGLFLLAGDRFCYSLFQNLYNASLSYFLRLRNKSPQSIKKMETLISSLKKRDAIAASQAIKQYYALFLQ
jgi:DNA-binding GntR family transcriptional regulator